MGLAKKLSVFGLIFFCMASVFANSLTGQWVTVDDKTGKKRAVVDLNIIDKELYGTIVHVYSQPGDKGICANCPDNFKNKPIEGLRFMWGLKNKGRGVWGDGKILDAKSGKIYNVKLKLVGNKLFVRGYVGVSILGRTQIWVRKPNQG